MNYFWVAVKALLILAAVYCLVRFVQYLGGI